MKKEICKNCTHYSAYYKQRGSGYENLRYGFCSIQKEQRKNNETCNNLKQDEAREKRQNTILYIYLEQAAKSINDIIHILKEKENDKIRDE